MNHGGLWESVALTSLSWIEMAELMFKYKIFCVGAFCKVAQLLSSWQWHRGYSMGVRIAFVPT